jgi:hypothetical protein
MRVIRAEIQTVEDMYRVVRTAVISKSPIRAVYHGRDRWFYPHRLGRNHAGQVRVLCYQYGGESGTGLEAAGSPANWRCIALENSAEWNCWTAPGKPGPTIPAPRRALRKSMWMLRISRSSRLRRRDSKATDRAVGGRWRSAKWRSSRDYGVRAGRGEPRGRKSGGGWAADNPRLLMRAEGEKRFRSATRNP